MNLLLDTHIAIWALNDDRALSSRARGLILDPGNTIYYSAVSVGNITIRSTGFCLRRQKWKTCHY